MLDAGPFGIAQLWELPGITIEEMAQFYQLIGYTVDGFAEIFGDKAPELVRKADDAAAEARDAS